MTLLKKSLNDYLALRRALGFKLVREGMWLPTLVRAIEQSGDAWVTTKVALRWAKGPKTPPPLSWSKRLCMARKFSQYLHARDSRHEILLNEYVPVMRSKRFEPYIYKDADVMALMNAARKICTRFNGETYSTLIGLLAATGMRVGEAIRLDRSDFDFIQGVLQIRHTKFGKSRQIPLHPSTIKALREYAKKRDRAVLHPSCPALFPSTVGTRLTHANLHFVFLKMVRAVDLDYAKPQRPRIHDLRHTFAIKTLTSWYQAGLDTGPRIPALSTYLGHVSPSSTYAYLHATPELLQQARMRLEQSQKGTRS
ncbi:MAG: tyrosine-type recombinase/integrase [Verrucomicrobiota bacterium]